MQKMLKSIKQINNKSSKILFWAVAFSSFIFFIMICLNVLVRYILNAPILGSIEISRLSFVWAAFLAAALAYRQKAHIAISFFVDRMPVNYKRMAELVIFFITFVFFSMLLIYSTQVTISLSNTYFPVLQLSQFWLYLPIPVVSLLIIMYCLEEIIETAVKYF